MNPKGSPWGGDSAQETSEVMCKALCGCAVWGDRVVAAIDSQRVPGVGVSLGVGKAGDVNCEDGRVKAVGDWGMAGKEEAPLESYPSKSPLCPPSPSAPLPESRQSCCCSWGAGAQGTVGAVEGKAPSEGLCRLAWVGEGWSAGRDPLYTRNASPSPACSQEPHGMIWGLSTCPESCAEMFYA